ALEALWVTDPEPTGFLGLSLGFFGVFALVASRGFRFAVLAHDLILPDGTFPPFFLHYTGMAARLQPGGRGPGGPPTVPQDNTPGRGTGGTGGTLTLQ